MIKLRDDCWVDVEGHPVPRACIKRPSTGGWFKIGDHYYAEDGTPGPQNPDAPRIESVYDLEIDPIKDALRRRSRSAYWQAIKSTDR